MERIDEKRVQAAIQPLVGGTVYIHFEVNPSGYWRNGSATLDAFHLKGDGPYRVFLAMNDGAGLIQLNALTHMTVEDNTLILAGYDDKDRISELIEVRATPFAG